MNIATEKTIVVDYKQPTQHKTITFLQYDTNIINFMVEDNGEVADLSNITKIIVNFKRPDRKVISQILTAVGNEITYQLTDSEMITPGECELVLQLHDDDERLSIARFKVKIEENIESGEAPTVEEVRLITQLINTVNEKLEELSEIEQGESNTSKISELQSQITTKANQTDVDSKFDNRDNLYKTTLQVTPKKNGYIHVVGGIDSLSEGAGGITYRSTFVPRMRGEFGVGGEGYIGFDSLNGVDAYGTVTSSGFLRVSDLPKGTSHALYSLDNKGVYIDNINGAEKFTHDLSLSVFDKITVFYLKQPNGGTFDACYNSAKSTTLQTINTNNATYDIGTIELNYKRNSSIEFDNCKGGKICIFGLFLSCDSGFIFSKIGKGGDKLQWHNSTSASIRAKWLELLKPDVFIFNGGINDRADLTSAQYNSSLRSYLQPFVDKSISIILCRPNAVNGGEDVTESYEPILVAYAKEKKLDYLNIKELLGRYTTASSLGYMQTDGVHPSQLGCIKIANALLDKLNVPKIGVTIADRIDPIPQSFITPLNVKRKEISVGVTDTIYKLGFKNSWTNGIVEIEVSGFRSGTTSIRKKRIKCYFQCATILNSCNSVGGVVVEDVFSFYNDGSVFDINLTAVLEGGLLSIKATPINHSLNIIANGAVTYSWVGAGRNVWDN